LAARPERTHPIMKDKRPALRIVGMGGETQYNEPDVGA